jgi:hypothetical protein
LIRFLILLKFIFCAIIYQEKMPLEVKNAIHNPLIITGDYQVQRFTNAVMIEAASNCTITLPLLDDTLIGFFLWIKRNDNNNFSVNVVPSVGNTIEGLSTITLSNHQGLGVLGFNETVWRYFSGDRFTIVTDADLATISPTNIGYLVYNTNAGFDAGVGLYYSDGAAWLLVSSGGSVTTLSPITGSGAPLDPIRLISGTSNFQLLQWSGSAWALAQGATNNQIFVDTGGNDATGQPNNPFRPYLTIAGARTAAIALGVQTTIYVRPGNHTLTSRLIANLVSYYFSPKCFITCTTTPFQWTAGDPVISEFQCYGYGDFFSTTASMVDIINITSFIVQADNLITSGADAILVATTGSVGAVNITVRQTIQSTIGFAARLRNATSGGRIYADNIVGATSGVVFDSSSSIWVVTSRNISGTSANGVLMSSTQNATIITDTITSALSVPVSQSNGTLNINSTNIAASNAGTYAVDRSGGALILNNFTTISGNTTGAGTPAVRINGGAGSASISGDTLVGIEVTGACTAIVSLSLNRLTNVGTSNNMLVNSSGICSVNLIAPVMIGLGNIMMQLNSTGAYTVNVRVAEITATTSTVLSNTNANNLVDVATGNIIGSTLGLFILSAGTNIISFDNINTTSASAAAFAIANASNNTITGCTLTSAGQNCLQVASTSSGTLNWNVMQTRATGVAPVAITTAGNPILNFFRGYFACSFNNAAGHVFSVTNTGTAVFKLFNCVGTKTNAGARIINSSAAMNVLVYSTFTTNDVSVNTTFQVGNNLVDALVV